MAYATDSQQIGSYLSKDTAHFANVFSICFRISI